MPDTRRTELEQMLARVAEGDRTTFDTLYGTTSAQLYALCLSILKDRPEAETTLKDIFVRIWRDAGRFAASGLSPMAWLITITRNMAIERLRVRMASPIPGTDSTPPRGQLAAVMPPADADLPVTAAFAGLDDDELRLLRRACLEGAGYAELAADAGIPQAALRTDMQAALLTLAAAPEAAKNDQLQAAELALGVLEGEEAQAAIARLSAEPPFAQAARDWQERLAAIVLGLTPVMAPARARQRLREELGHGVPPLSVDPTDQPGWWSSPWVILSALVLIGAGIALFWL